MSSEVEMMRVEERRILCRVSCRLWVRLVSGFSQASAFKDEGVSGLATRCGSHDSPMKVEMLMSIRGQKVRSA